MELLFTVLIIIFIIIEILITYFAIKYSVNRARKENMSKIDFSRDKDYYREVLKEYSAVELSYIDDFIINPKRECVSTILNLKLKHKLKIEENGIVVLDNNEEGLKKTEKFILKNVQNGKVKINDSTYIESFAQDEAIEDGLIVKSVKGKKRIKKLIISTVLSFIAIVLIFIALSQNAEKLNQIGIGVPVIIIFALILFFSFQILPIINIVYTLIQINPYERTEKGEEINKKIEGLKNYMKEYSLIENRGENELTIWEEYLIYSVIFSLNKTNIVEKISNFIDIEYERVELYKKIK